MKAKVSITMMLALLASCYKEQPVRKQETALELLLLEKASLEEKVTYESCMGNRYHSVDWCMSDLIEGRRKQNKPQTVIQQNEGTSIVKTAVGTAVGIGAAKVLFGK